MTRGSMISAAKTSRVQLAAPSPSLVTIAGMTSVEAVAGWPLRQIQLHQHNYSIVNFPDKWHLSFPAIWHRWAAKQARTIRTIQIIEHEIT